MSQSKHSLLEIIGIIGVFAGLLLVAYELRQNSIAAQAQTRATLTVIAHDMIRSVTTPEMQDIRLKRDRDETLNDVEAQMLRLNLSMQIRSAENVFYQHRIGTLSDEEFIGYRNFYKRLFSDSFTIQYWEQQREIFSPDFQVDIDDLIAEIQ